MIHLFLALRYLKGRKKIVFTFSNMLSLFGIIIGVFSLLVVSSVMNGFELDMKNRVIGSKAEIKISDKNYSPIKNYTQILEKVDNIPKVSHSAPVCQTELMLQNKKNLASTICFGIDLERQNEVTEILDKIVIGYPSSDDLENDGIIIGLDLSLTINATVGEYIQLSSPIGTVPSPFGLLPKTKKLEVVGIFLSGMPEYDKLFTYISLKNSQFFLDYEDEVNQIEVKTQNSDQSAKVANQIQAVLGDDFVVEDWSEFDANLFNAIKLEKVVMFLVLALMIIIASFNMTGNFIKLVAEKKVEIGVLKAIGASEKDIVRLFVNVGLIIGIIGTFVGVAFALILLLAQDYWHFIKIPVAGFPLQWIPVDIRLLDFIIVPIVVIVISFLTTLHPARRTVKIDPIKIIRS